MKRYYGKAYRENGRYSHPIAPDIMESLTKRLSNLSRQNKRGPKKRLREI